VIIRTAKTQRGIVEPVGQFALQMSRLAQIDLKGQDKRFQKRLNMLRFFSALLGVLALNAVNHSNAAVIELTSLSRETVANAVASAAPGDRVVLPSGSATWDAPLIISKSITLMGAGIDLTTITGNFTNAFEGIISFRPDDAARAADLPFRISGFTLNADNKCNGIRVINASATPVTKVRIDHNRVLNAGGINAGRAVHILGSVYGVADNNVLENYKEGMAVDGTGNLQWDNMPIEIGTEKNFFFEDNSISSTGANIFCAGGQGGRYVARYNQCKNLSSAGLWPAFDMHGNQPPDIPGTMVVEIYGNDIDFGTQGGRVFDHRGGRLMAFFNRIKWGANGVSIAIREEYVDSSYPPGNNYLMHVNGSYYWNNRANDTLMNAPGVISNQYEDTYDLAENVDFWFHNPSERPSEGYMLGLSFRPRARSVMERGLQRNLLTSMGWLEGILPTLFLAHFTNARHQTSGPNLILPFLIPTP
jgi:hypothetical protein